MNSPEFNDLFLGHKIQVNSGPIFQLNSPDFLKKNRSIRLTLKAFMFHVHAVLSDLQVGSNFKATLFNFEKIAHDM